MGRTTKRTAAPSRCTGTRPQDMGPFERLHTQARPLDLEPEDQMRPRFQLFARSTVAPAAHAAYAIESAAHGIAHVRLPYQYTVSAFNLPPSYGDCCQHSAAPHACGTYMVHMPQRPQAALTSREQASRDGRSVRVPGAAWSLPVPSVGQWGMPWMHRSWPLPLPFRAHACSAGTGVKASISVPRA